MIVGDNRSCDKCKKMITIRKWYVGKGLCKACLKIKKGGVV